MEWGERPAAPSRAGRYCKAIMAGMRPRALCPSRPTRLDLEPENPGDRGEDVRVFKKRELHARFHMGPRCIEGSHSSSKTHADRSHVRLTWPFAPPDRSILARQQPWIASAKRRRPRITLSICNHSDVKAATASSARVRRSRTRRAGSVSPVRSRELPGEPVPGALPLETWHCGCWRRIPLLKPLPRR